MALGTLLQRLGRTYQAIVLSGSRGPEGNEVGEVNVRTIGIDGVEHNRNIPEVSATYNAAFQRTWTEAENVRQLKVTLISAEAAEEALSGHDGILYVVNAPDTDTASMWLSDAGGASQDVRYDAMYITQEMVYQQDSPITSFDAVAIINKMRVVIQAIGD